MAPQTYPKSTKKFVIPIPPETAASNKVGGAVCIAVSASKIGNALHPQDLLRKGKCLNLQNSLYLEVNSMLRSESLDLHFFSKKIRQPVGTYVTERKTPTWNANG